MNFRFRMKVSVLSDDEFFEFWIKLEKKTKDDAQVLLIV